MKINDTNNAMDSAKVILLVDDEPDIGIIYAMLFEIYNFRVVNAANGKEALEMIASVKPDIVVSDYMMPLMSGAELCVKLKNDPAQRNTPFILMSAAYQIKEPQKIPYDCLLQKPVAFENLLKEVVRLLDSKQ